MKNIGLVVATETEFETIFKNKNTTFKTLETTPFIIKEVIINDKKIVAINCGIGEIYSAIATQYLINKYNINCILNYGVVGSLSDSINLNNVVFVDKIFDYQFDLSPIDNVPVGYHEELNSLYINISNNIFDDIKTKFKNIQSVTCASGNKFVSEVEEKDYLFNKFNCQICEMESLGIALTAIKNNIPVIFIKGVSDTKTGGAKEYKNMVEQSATAAFNVLLSIIESI